MLHRVSMGQVRFNAPGLKADIRGVVTGRAMVFRFSALERLVSFLRLWSAEQALDDFQPGLRLVQVRTTAGTREALVVVPVTSLPLIDTAARAARLAGGQCFTGAGKHFVQYRDSHAPLGYDVDALEPLDEATEFVLYGLDHTQAFVVLSELALDKLLLRMDLQRQPSDAWANGMGLGKGEGAGAGTAAVRRDLLFLTVRRGLGPLVIGYLHRAGRQNSGLRVSAALCDSPGEVTFQRGNTFWILRLENLPPRLLGTLSRTPGLSLFVPVSDNVAIAIDHRHPVHLASCKTAFPAGRFFLFSPAPVGVTVISPAPVFAAVADLVRLQPMELGPRAVTQVPSDKETSSEPWSLSTVRPTRSPELSVRLRLEPAPVGLGRAVATLVPWQRAAWVRSLCYALPPSAMRGYRLALLERGILVIAPDTLDAFPFGQLLHSPAPGLLVPLGWELRPAVSPDQLAARVGATAGALVVFPGPDQAPFRIPAEALGTLEARALADRQLDEIPTERSVGRDLDDGEVLDIEIENLSLGPMPLWRMSR